MSIFSDRLRELRQERKLTLKRTSEALHIPLTTYANYEQGTREPPIWLLCAMCDFFEVSADYLIGRNDDY